MPKAIPFQVWFSITISFPTSEKYNSLTLRINSINYTSAIPVRIWLLIVWMLIHVNRIRLTAGHRARIWLAFIGGVLGGVINRLTNENKLRTKKNICMLLRLSSRPAIRLGTREKCPRLLKFECEDRDRARKRTTVSQDYLRVGLP